MNKLIYACLFTAMISFTSLAQLTSGFEVGGNLMSADIELQDFSGNIDTKNSWGVRLGFVVEYKASESVFFRGASLINQRGFKLAGERWALTAIDVPLNIGYSIPINNKGLEFFVDAGINLEFNVKAFTKVDGEIVDFEIGKEEDDIKPFATGFNIGSGLRLSATVKIRLNYYQGFTNLLRTSGDKWKNQVIGLSFDYFFF